jgi:hydroxyacylglutathione hydrolase
MLTVQTFTFNPVQENTYVLYNEAGHCCIIDPGCYFASEETALRQFLENNNLKPVLLLNTHCHLDHIFGNLFVHRTWNLKLHLHKAEKTVLDRGPEMGERWGLPFDNYDGELAYIAEGDKITLGNDVLHVLFTPGHSPGSVCFYCADQDFVIGGDVLFRRSIGRTDLPGGDFDTLKNSIMSQLYPLPDAVVVYPGHGGPTTIGEEKRENPFVKG